jgi:cobalt-zinc-cadmium efflux system membrane fusion protein
MLHLDFAKAALAGALLCLASGALAASEPVVAQSGAKGQAAKEPARQDQSSQNQSKEQGGKDSAAAHGALALTEKQIAAAEIDILPVTRGAVQQTMAAPGVVMVDQDRIARVPVRVAGSIAQLNKKLGDDVQKDEVVAIIDSREAADAKSEYLSALVALDLQKTLFERTEALWTKKIATEQAYLQARATYVAADLRLRLARQKLIALGLDAQAITALKPDGPNAALDLRQYPVRSPMAGRIIERKVDVGAAVGANNDPSELYVVADLTSLWVELSVPLADLDGVHEGQSVVISGLGGREGRARIVFIGPVVNQETRAARVLASLPNADLAWRPGAYVSAKIELGAGKDVMLAPRSAIQMFDGQPNVFVRTNEGFVRRQVTLGRADADKIEIVEGLAEGEKIAVRNTFLLKAELGKAEAAHDH